jgi:hypothetical protein
MEAFKIQATDALVKLDKELAKVPQLVAFEQATKVYPFLSLIPISIQAKNLCSPRNWRFYLLLIINLYSCVFHPSFLEHHGESINQPPRLRLSRLLQFQGYRNKENRRRHSLAHLLACFFFP